jgi:uncharacterized protein YbbC (DUF1343 family)
MFTFRTVIATLFLLPILISCTPPADPQPSRVRTGAEVLLRDHLSELQGRSVGLVMNPTARVHGTHMLDTLRSLNVEIAALYSPEHGFRGNFGAGERISDGIDEATGLPVFSLYGQTRKPTPAMLEGIDLLLFDMQDVGARFYTYLSTMGLVLEAAAENGVEVWILDRPNPAGGEYVAGWMLEPEYTSFVGAYPIPIAHGMTLGELARLIIGEQWLNVSAEVAGTLKWRIIAAEQWSRSMLWPETGLPWVPPSPNLPTFAHAWMYLGTCLIEGTTMSEGRGTDQPFLLIGSPDLNIPAHEIDRLSRAYHITISDTIFVPVEIPGRALRPKHQDVENRGLFIQVSEHGYQATDPVAFGHDLLRTVLKHAPESQTNAFLPRLAGTSRILDYLADESGAAELWSQEIAQFRALRKPYLLY